ncbi:MAG: signal peptidase I [Acidobacteria bacterium]|nr:signal peptidase I [Acidobacteriota bacterium]
MEMKSGKRVVAGLLSAIVPGSGQLIKKEMKKAILYLTVFAFLLFLTWTTTLYDTLVGLVVLKIGTTGLALVASLDAFLIGAASKPRYLILVPSLAALFLGDAMMGGLMLSKGARAFSIPSTSMQPAIMQGDRIFVDSYRKNSSPQQGDIVVYLSPDTPRLFAVKRIIGVPGDRIHLRDGVVYRNGQKLDEPYALHQLLAHNPYPSYGDNFPAVPPLAMYGVNERWQQEFRSHVEGDDIVVPPGSYFALGDNRDVSYDSRYWGFIPRENIIGRPMFIYWPAARLGHRLAG